MSRFLDDRWALLCGQGVAMAVTFQFRVFDQEFRVLNPRLETRNSKPLFLNPQPGRNVRWLPAHLPTTDGGWEQFCWIEASVGIEGSSNTRHGFKIGFIEQESYVSFFL